VTLEADAVINHPTTLHLQSSSILMRYSSALQAETIILEAGLLHLEGEAVLDVRGAGDLTGRGAGGLTLDGHGMGGGHGGYGGGWTKTETQHGQYPDVSV
jgi:hypothetical protein